MSDRSFVRAIRLSIYGRIVLVLARMVAGTYAFVAAFIASAHDRWDEGSFWLLFIVILTLTIDDSPFPDEDALVAARRERRGA